MVSTWVLVLAGPAGRHPETVGVDTALTRLTEPILAPVRWGLPPLRLGAVALVLSIPGVLIGLSLPALLIPAA